MTRHNLYSKDNFRKVYELFNYLQKNYKCKIENRQQFAKTLIRNASSPRYPTTDTIDGIMQEWEFWKPYLDEKSMERFVKADLYDIFRFECTATSYCITNEEMYVGLKAKVKDPEKLPFQTCTVVKLSGVFMVNGYAVRRIP